MYSNLDKCGLDYLLYRNLKRKNSWAVVCKEIVEDYQDYSLFSKNFNQLRLNYEKQLKKETERK